MGKKQSSFHMGNEFNGNGEVRYLKGTQPCIHPPVSQENVQLTPDFGNYLLKVLGSIPVAISPLNINPALFALLGSMASVTQVIITKDPVTGNYDFYTKSLVRRILQMDHTLILFRLWIIRCPQQWELKTSGWPMVSNGNI